MKRHVNIPVFIPHLGCPNQCVFCNQRVISGAQSFDPETLTNIIEEALSSIEADAEVEIAFFGGSFTGIDRELMIRLLKIASGYIKSGRVTSIRCSTRPDYISEEILDILWSHGVRTIELGLQSSVDDVLSASKRGHTKENELRAASAIKERGFSLVGQMMIGLPGSTLEYELETARFIVGLKADAARIYPTVVFIGTELAEMAQCGEYAALSNDDAARRAAEVFSVFVQHGVKVIRIGLCASENLSSDETYVAGPNHPAMGELVLGEYFYKRIADSLDIAKDYSGFKLNIQVSRGSLSRAVGLNKRNKNKLIQTFGFSAVKFAEDLTLDEYEVVTKTERI